MTVADATARWSPTGPARDRILGAMALALRESPWSEVSLSDLAARSGVSRQTVYNTFGSRSGLALAYLSELVASLIAQNLPAAASTARSDLRAGLVAGFRSFFEAASVEPFSSLRLDGRDGLSVPGALVEPHVLMDEASSQLARAYAAEWPTASDVEAGILARAVVRLCVSYVVYPPGPEHDAADELATLLTPWVQTVSGHRHTLLP